MKMTRRKIAFAITALTCTTAFAQSDDFGYNPSWYVMPSIGAIHPDSKFGNDGDEGWAGGLYFGKPISQHWDLQFGANYGKSDNNGVDYKQILGDLDFLYLFKRDHFRPFLLVGGGVQRDDVSGTINGISVDRAKSNPQLHAGLGFQYDLSDQWFTQVDVRRVHGWLDDQDFGFDRANTTYFRIGFSYVFDKPAQKVAAAPPPEPTPAPAPPPPATKKFERYTLAATELFGFNSAELNASQPKLDEIAQALNDNPSVDKVDIIGYTDRIGSKKYNEKLSLRRAEAVKAYLVGKGVDGGRLVTEGRGKDNPVVECNQKKRAELIKCLEPNRRVEVEEITVKRQAE